MVATTKQAVANSTSLIADPSVLLSTRGNLVRFTVDDVMIMMRQGILPEDSTTELLDGLVVMKDRSDLGEDPLVLGPRHRLCIRLLTTLGSKIETANRHVQIQLPIVCGGEQMPEPDFAIIRGRDRDYANRLPTEADVLAVMEAADSSLERDGGEKLRIYASCGIMQYAIINLRNSTVELFRDPDQIYGAYRLKTTVQRNEFFSLIGLPDGDVQVLSDDILS